MHLETSRSRNVRGRFVRGANGQTRVGVDRTIVAGYGWGRFVRGRANGQTRVGVGRTIVAG